jgi:assimilatory nitrate reductase catalytic subunit
MLAPTAISQKPVKTTCPYCGVGCGVIARADGEGKLSITGDKEHPSNFGRLCSKGSALGETIDLKHRLLYPIINGEQANWSDALTAIADGFTRTIKEHGPDSVAFYVSGQLLTEDYYVANKLMKGFIGSANIDSNSRLCMSSAVSGYKRAFGNDTVGLCYEDLEEADTIIIIGSNIAWCHPVLFQRIEKAREEKGIKLIVIDPRRTSTCDIADQHIAIKPGTDAVLYNGLLNYLDDQDQIDYDYVNNYTTGFKKALTTSRESVKDLDSVAERCELSIKQVEEFYRSFSNNEKVISFFSMGINQSSSGVDKVNCIINAHLASGKIGKPGMGAFSITGQPNAMGGREVGGLANTLAAHMDFDNKEIVQRFWQSPVIAKQAGLKAVDLFDDVFSGKIKALWIMATNPAVSIPNANLVQQAMEKCDLVVVSDCIENTDTTRYADILLPAQGWAEKSGTVTNSERRISRQRQILKSAGEAKPDWWIVCEVAKRMGYESSFQYNSEVDIFREHAKLSGFENQGERDFDISFFNNISEDDYASLQPVQWPVNKNNPQGRKRLLENGQFYTKDKKARFIEIIPRLPVGETSDDYPLILNTGRVRDQWHTMTRTAKSQRLSRHIKEPFVQCHPHTAIKYNLFETGLARIKSRNGEVLVKVEITDRQRQGEIFVPLHWNDQFSARARVDTVVNSYTDPISGQPEFKQTPVSIKPVKHAWHGFLLSRSEINLNVLQYWSLLREENCWHYEFSDTVKHELDWFQQLIPQQGIEWITYQDEFNGQNRSLWFKENELQGCIFTARNLQDLPDREWLSEQFITVGIPETQRIKLLAGTSDSGKPAQGSIVCSCFNIGKNIILDAINKYTLTDVDAIGKTLKAGTNCGSCRPELKCLLEQAAYK